MERERKFDNKGGGMKALAGKVGVGGGAGELINCESAR